MITRVTFHFSGIIPRKQEQGKHLFIAGYGMRTREKFSPLGLKLQETSGTRTSKWPLESQKWHRELTHRWRL